MATMHRLQICIPEWQYRFLQQRAQQSNRSIADVIRTLIQREAKARQPGDVADDPIWEVVGVVQSGLPRDASERVEELVYGGAG